MVVVVMGDTFRLQKKVEASLVGKGGAGSCLKGVRMNVEMLETGNGGVVGLFTHHNKEGLRWGYMEVSGQQGKRRRADMEMFKR